MAAKFSGTLTLDPGSVANQHISNAAADQIDSSKQKHIHRAMTNFDLAIGGTPATREEVVYVATAAATVKLFRAMLYDTGTSTSVTFDLKKNGSTILSGTISVTHSDSDRTVKDGTISNTTLAADDVLSILLTVSSSTGAQGPYSEVWIEESGTPA